MEHLIIDVVIGLLLIYIAASFLLMKIQEGVHGGMLKGRVSNMHRVLDEAVGHDPALKKQVLENRLIFSLWGGQGEATEGMRFTPGVGPSKIPGDLFARALLMSLNPSRNLPSSEARPPLAFMDTLLKSEAKDSQKAAYLRALRGLIPGRASGWPEFEMAIATWFCDISDRAEGWYKRKTEVVGIWLAVLLCLAINIDTRHIVNVLGSDVELRQGFGALAELVVQQQQGGSAAAPAKPVLDPAVDPVVRAIARLRDAQRYVHEAFRKDPRITAYGAYEDDIEKVCGPQFYVPPKPPKDPNEPKSEEKRFVSNSDSWVLLLTRLQPALQKAIHRVDQSQGDRALHEVYACLSHVAAWVNSATVASNNADTRHVMLEAAKAIEDSASAVLSIIRSSESFGGLRRLFQIDPEAFERCAQMKLQSAAAMSACVLKDQALMNRLPIGHGGANWRQQFCRVDSDRSAGAQAQTREPEKRGAMERQFCGDQVLPAQPHLGLPSLRLTFDGSGFVTSLFGILISALFISLGAPVLFEFLNKWIRLKNAGNVRDATRSGIQGAGTLPLPMLAVPGAVAPGSGGAGAAIAAADLPALSTVPAVEGARAGFEETLSPREVQALKQRLGIQPSTGGFDDATRSAIRQHTGGADLTLASFVQLMGRAPVQAGQVVGALPTNRPQLRQPFALAPTLADNLNAKLSFPGRVPATTTTFSDELRALAVLYRFKKDTDQTHTAPVFRIVDTHPEQLDQIDEALLNELLNASAIAHPRFPKAPWLDIALGELGQVERKGSSRATSNPRVCEYLDAARAGLGDQGDTTPWCAAFVTWVLKHPHARPGGAPAAPVPAGWIDPGNGLLLPAPLPNEPRALETAASWKQWPRPAGGVATAPAGPQGTPPPEVGDVVVVDVGNGKFHTGFVFQVSAASNEFWMLGGNQHDGTRVCLSRWALTSIA